MENKYQVLKGTEKKKLKGEKRQMGRVRETKILRCKLNGKKRLYEKNIKRGE